MSDQRKLVDWNKKALDFSAEEAGDTRQAWHMPNYLGTNLYERLVPE